MAPKILNYHIIIEPDKRTGSNKPCYTAYCPSLGLVDEGDTAEMATKNIKKLIQFHLECLSEEGNKVNWRQTQKSLATTVQVKMPSV